LDWKLHKRQQLKNPSKVKYPKKKLQKISKIFSKKVTKNQNDFENFEN